MKLSHTFRRIIFSVALLFTTVIHSQTSIGGFLGTGAAMFDEPQNVPGLAISGGIQFETRLSKSWSLEVSPQFQLKSIVQRFKNAVAIYPDPFADHFDIGTLILKKRVSYVSLPIVFRKKLKKHPSFTIDFGIFATEFTPLSYSSAFRKVRSVTWNLNYNDLPVRDGGISSYDLLRKSTFIAGFVFGIGYKKPLNDNLVLTVDVRNYSDFMVIPFTRGDDPYAAYSANLMVQCGISYYLVGPNRSASGRWIVPSGKPEQ